MDTSRWLRDTSLLALSLSINGALRSIGELNRSESQGIRKHSSRGNGSNARATLKLAPQLMRKRIPAA
jgi:hypothetical protein